MFPSRRNCKGNPNCLVGLGEKEWLGDITDDRWHEVDDPNLERREKVRLEPQIGSKLAPNAQK